MNEMTRSLGRVNLFNCFSSFLEQNERRWRWGRKGFQPLFLRNLFLILGFWFCLFFLLFKSS